MGAEVDAGRSDDAGRAAAPAPRLPAGALELRRLRLEDAGLLHEAVVASADHLRPWMSWAAEEPLSLDDRRALLARWDGAWEDGSSFHYGMLLGERLVGCCGLHRRMGPGGLEIGYWVRAGWTGRGVARTAARALVAAAFALPDVTHVEIRHDVANVASGRVPQALGFTCVGELACEVSAPAETGLHRRWRLDRPA